jgi:hypothetical protein
MAGGSELAVLSRRTGGKIVGFFGEAQRRLPFLASKVLASLGVALLTACAAVPWPGGAPPPVAAARNGEGLLDLRGVVHVHTRGSHDSPGTIEAVLRAARSAGLAWIALTEHTRPGRLPRHGEIEGVTVLPGYEVRAAGGSILAIGVSQPVPRFEDFSDLVGWIHAAGGVAFVGHFEKSRLAEPGAYRHIAPDGVEIVNLHAQARTRRFGLALRMFLLPARRGLRSLLEVPAENMARWEALPEARTIVGGVDAHNKVRLFGALGGTFDRYRDLFRMLTTHVLATERDAEGILAALRSGRSYVAFEGLAPVEGFRFEARQGGYYLQAPRVARLVLVCDGVEVDSALAEAATLSLPQLARKCRGEAWLGERLWVVTSYRAVPETRSGS